MACGESASDRAKWPAGPARPTNVVRTQRHFEQRGGIVKQTGGQPQPKLPPAHQSCAVSQEEVLGWT